MVNCPVARLSCSGFFGGKLSHGEFSGCEMSSDEVTGGKLSHGEFSGCDMSSDEVTGGKLSSGCLLYTSPSPRDMYKSRMPSSA